MTASTHYSNSSLTMSHLVTLAGRRSDMREALNWCFDNCPSFALEEVRVLDAEDGLDYAEFTMLFHSDRDAVLFKTFWNDR